MKYCNAAPWRYLLFLLLICPGLQTVEAEDIQTPTIATEDSPTPLMRKVDIGFALMDFRYKEYDDAGKLLDREDGFIPGVVLGLSESDGDWDYKGTFLYHAGNVRYDGQTNSGIPITTRTDEKIIDATFHAERWYRDSNDQKRYAWYGGLGYRHWFRDIRSTSTSGGLPVSGLTETYQWWYVLVGGKRILSDAGKSQWQADLRVTRTIQPTIHIELPGFDNTTQDLGERFGVRLSLPWRYELEKASVFFIEPYKEAWSLGRSPTTPLSSNGVPVGTIYEPRSEGRNYGIILGLSRDL